MAGGAGWEEGSREGEGVIKGRGRVRVEGGREWGRKRKRKGEGGRGKGRGRGRMREGGG